MDEAIVSLDPCLFEVVAFVRMVLFEKLGIVKIGFGEFLMPLGTVVPTWTKVEDPFFILRIEFGQLFRDDFDRGVSKL